MLKKKHIKVFFNASVVLAGLKSPLGGSGTVLNWVKKNKVKGIISEVIFDEIMRRVNKVGLTQKEAQTRVSSIFSSFLPAPKEKLVRKYYSIVIDQGDAHVLVSAEDARCDFLVTLDKKHLLILQKKIKRFKIVSPGQLISLFSGHITLQECRV